MLVTTNALKIDGKVCEDEVEVEIDLLAIDDEITSYITKDGDYEIRELADLDYDSAEANALIDGFKTRQPDIVDRCQRFLEELTGRTI